MIVTEVFMTALYAFASKAQRKSAIAADDLALPYQARCDKITLLEGRFAIAVSGADIACHAMDILKAFEHRPSHMPLKSIDTIANSVLSATRRLSEALYPHYQKALIQGYIRRDAWAACLKSDVGLLILDCVDYELFSVNLGKPFPPYSLATSPGITIMKQTVLHRDALARRAVGPNYDQISPLETDNPRKLFETKLDEDRNLNPSIGKLGTVLTAFEGSINYTPCINTVEEYIRETIGKVGVTGFHINVY